MPSFPLSRNGSVPGAGWRPLRLTDPFQRGWDVYDLQNKLNYVGVSRGGTIVTDGVFGPATRSAVLAGQTDLRLTVDGIAGAATQTALAKACCARSAMAPRVLGQMQKESSLLCGIYTPTYLNGSQDTGPLQMNTAYHPNLNENFNVARAIPVLVARIQEYANKYLSWGVSSERAWDAAQGAWNSPVYADKYAKNLWVPDTFKQYVADVSVYA